MRVLPTTLALLVSCAALAGDSSKATAPSLGMKSAPRGLATAPANTVTEAWQRLPKKGNGCSDEDLVFDYGREGGLRNFYCRAKQVFSMETLQSLAPPIFRKGPHFKTGALDLHNDREFGFYDPAFVQWAGEHLVPAASDATLKKATQPIYNAQVRDLARLYHLVDLSMSRDPAWIDNERKVYLGALDSVEARGGGWNNYALIEPYENIIGPAGDPNLARHATTWWLRRHHDGTAPQWRVGLTKLLSTYDAKWLQTAQATKTPLPKRKA